MRKRSEKGEGRTNAPGPHRAEPSSAPSGRISGGNEYCARARRARRKNAAKERDSEKEREREMREKRDGRIPPCLNLCGCREGARDTHAGWKIKSEKGSGGRKEERDEEERARKSERRERRRTRRDRGAGPR